MPKEKAEKSLCMSGLRHAEISSQMTEAKLREQMA